MEIVLGISAGINVVLLIWCFISRRKRKILKREKNELILGFQSYPHIVRNKIDDLSERTNSLKDKVNALYEEINSVSDYLGEMAYGDVGSQEETLIPISEEIAMMRNYVKTSCEQSYDNIVINVDDKITDSDFKLPDQITVSMIENAFKHGDTFAPDFMKIDITEKKNGSYEIIVRNKIKADGITKKRELSGLGIKNMKERIANYNEYNYEYKGSLHTTNKRGYFYFKLLFEKI
ncbi:MAG: hypothetical protein J6T48_03965 [Bacteroidales bacterium]|nr:hypothetical protein [Bacteroidales bacterium]